MLDGLIDKLNSSRFLVVEFTADVEGLWNTTMFLLGVEDQLTFVQDSYRETVWNYGVSLFALAIMNG